MKKKSMGINAILNVTKTICSVVFPLITFPYVSRIFGVDSLGAYNFCTSIISYFILLAGLGINTYAVAEGTKYRDDRAKFEQFASEVFSVNVFSMLFTYVLFFFCLFFFSKLGSFKILLSVLSVQILFNTFGCEWVFNIYEDFAFITMRSIAFQIISMVFLFVFVHSETDLINYAVITVVSASGANVINFFSRKKYCGLHLVINRSVLSRVKPILILFATNVATTIYVNSDTTMLGIFADTTAVGLYSVSTKVYTILKNILGAIITVSIPRLSSKIARHGNSQDYADTANSLLNILLLISFPIMIGTIVLSGNVVEFISGKEYAEASMSLKILGIAFFFSVVGWFYNSCVLLVNNRRKEILVATVVAALANVFLNLFVIARFKQNGAAFTTVVAEFLNTAFCMYYGRDLLKIKISASDLLSEIVGALLVLVVCVSAKVMFAVNTAVIIAAVAFSVIVYFAVLLIFRNSAVRSLKKIIRI